MELDKILRIVFYVFCSGLIVTGPFSMFCGLEGTENTYFDSKGEFLGIAVIGAFVILIFILGMVAVCRQSPSAIRVYIVLASITFVANLTMLCMTYHFPSQFRYDVVDLVEEAWKKEIVTPGSMDHLQKKFDCCGADGSNDYKLIDREVPETCCTGSKAVCKGCKRQMYEDMEDLYSTKNLYQHKTGFLLLSTVVTTIWIAIRQKRNRLN